VKSGNGSLRSQGAWNERDFDRLRAISHPEYTYTGPDGEEQPGVENR